jgi:hypothetical protein
VIFPCVGTSFRIPPTSFVTRAGSACLSAPPAPPPTTPLAGKLAHHTLPFPLFRRQAEYESEFCGALKYEAPLAYAVRLQLWNCVAVLFQHGGNASTDPGDAFGVSRIYYTTAKLESIVGPRVVPAPPAAPDQLSRLRAAVASAESSVAAVRREKEAALRAFEAREAAALAELVAAQRHFEAFLSRSPQ